MIFVEIIAYILLAILHVLYYGAILLPVAIIVYFFIEDRREYKKSKTFCRRKRIDYRINAFLNYEKLDL